MGISKINLKIYEFFQQICNYERLFSLKFQVAASHDPKAQFMYNIKTRLQPPREEIILELQQMVREQIMFFYKKTGQKPLKIIFYRYNEIYCDLFS